MELGFADDILKRSDVPEGHGALPAVSHAVFQKPLWSILSWDKIAAKCRTKPKKIEDSKPKGRSVGQSLRAAQSFEKLKEDTTMTILELREKRAKAWGSRKGIFWIPIETIKGILSAEDDAAYTRMEQEITDLGKGDCPAWKRQEALDAELNRPVNKPLTGKPMNGKGGG